MNLVALCLKYRFIPKGIIHVGAHQAEEISVYDLLRIKNVVWIEANSELISSLQEKIYQPKNLFQKTFNLKPHKKHVLINSLISDEDNKEYEFKITNNAESSSILELDQHLKYHPEIHVVNSKYLTSKRLDTIVKEHSINMKKFNFLNLDIQGAELLALKGFSENLAHIKYIYTEVNNEELYKDCALIGDLDNYLSTYGFKRKETRLTEYKWGDAFYIKQKI
jgi:FkbM family methyltransferase